MQVWIVMYSQSPSCFIAPHSLQGTRCCGRTRWAAQWWQFGSLDSRGRCSCSSTLTGSSEEVKAGEPRWWSGAGFSPLSSRAGKMQLGNQWHQGEWKRGVSKLHVRGARAGRGRRCESRSRRHSAVVTLTDNMVLLLSGGELSSQHKTFPLNFKISGRKNLSATSITCVIC